MNLAFLQARMNSKRLPGKVLMPICGKTVLDHVFERVNKAKLVDKVYVLTGIDPENNPIVQHCIDHGYNYYVGDDENVLARFYGLAEIVSKDRLDNIIRITADCPLVDPYIIDEMLLNMQGDYYTNQRNYIDGFDVEIIKRNLLNTLYLHESKEDEHVTLKFKTNRPGMVRHHEHPKDLHGVHLSLDTEEDYQKIKSIFEALYWNNPNFGYKDVIELMGIK